MVILRPHRATHALLTTPDGKKALVDIDDLDTLRGSSGIITWMRLTRSLRERIGEELNFNGEIEEIKSDYRKQQ